MKYHEIKGLTKIHHGGSNPQNVSAISAEAKGDFYLLPSLPPPKPNPKLPQKDFFKEVANKKYFHQSFRDIAVKGQDIDFDAGELSVNEIIVILKEYHPEFLKAVNWTVDRVISLSWGIKAHNKKWTEHINLPEYQKIWLDDARGIERNEEIEEKVLDALYEWFCKTLEYHQIRVHPNLLDAIEQTCFDVLLGSGAISCECYKTEEHHNG